MTNNITTEISNSKKIYFDNLAEKLSDPKLNRKAYWGILKSFTNWKKIPIIPPLLINDQLVTNFNEKANTFNEYFFSVFCNRQQHQVTHRPSPLYDIVIKFYWH